MLKTEILRLEIQFFLVLLRMLQDMKLEDSKTSFQSVLTDNLHHSQFAHPSHLGINSQEPIN